MTRLFFDTEFTGLHQKTTLISIGIVSAEGKSFYAELTDYDETQLDEWLQENIIDNLILTDKGMKPGSTLVQYDNEKMESATNYYGDRAGLKEELEKWFAEFEDVEIWSDCLSYDWVLFNEIFGHAFNIPKNIFYIPFDICTSFRGLGIDPDVNREEYAFYKDVPKDAKKHNALWDANIIKMCFERLQSGD
jgi:hypothetical protein